MNTVNSDEVNKFSSIADEWWDINGKFKKLHEMNPIRIEYIKDNIIKKFQTIENKKILDIGCGGGLLCEPMARMGGIVTGVDASEENINIAKMHAQKQNLNINYTANNIENLPINQKYDVITAMEIIEHVDNIPLFLESCCNLLNDNGILFISTMNRTPKSFLQTIIIAEYILNWIPKGTHNWNKYPKPSEINDIINKYDIYIQDIKGIKYNLLNNNWHLTNKIDINYIMTCYK